MRSRRWIVYVVVAVAALLVLGRIAAGWDLELEWYGALGAAAVWRAKALDLILLRGTTFLAGTAFVFLNLYTFRHSVKKVVLPRRVGNLDIGEELPGSYLLTAVVVLSVIMGALLALALPHDNWMSLDLVRYGEPFGETDPYFQRDLAFWLYWLPLETSLHTWALVSLVSVSLVVVLLYALTPSLRWENGAIQVSRHVRRHLFTLCSTLLFVLSWGYRLDAYALLNAGSGPLGTFSAIDHRVGLPASLILSVITLSAAMLVLWSGWAGQVRLAFFTVGAVLLMALAVRQIVPPVAERFVTPGDPELRDRPYRATRDGYTRRAYDVDRLTRDEAATPDPSFADAAREASLWDGAAIARLLARSRPAATPAGSLGWDVQDGRPVAFTVDRPVGPDEADSQPAWPVARAAADVADEQGEPVERANPDNLPSGSLSWVLVSDSASGYYVVSDSADRLKAPELASLRTRIAAAWELQDAHLLGSASGPHVRLMFRRDVRERLHALYPFFVQGTEVSPIVWRDSLYWAVHLYATSTWYPLSEPIRFRALIVHYLRHAAVALVNAHTGRTTAIGDPFPDPVTASWMRRFPASFSEPSSIDRGITDRIPPAPAGTLVTAIAFARVGVRLSQAGPFHLARRTGDSLFTFASQSPYYSRSRNVFSLAVPLLDSSDRVAGVITSDGGAEYRLRWRPLPAPAMRWNQLVDRLQQQDDSLRVITRDTRLFHGQVRLVPTSQGLFAVQTHYATRPDGTIEELYVSLMRDVTAPADSVVVGSSVINAAGIPAPVTAQAPLSPDEFRARVETLYGAMREALRRGDWSAFGVAYEALGRLLRAGGR